MFALSSEQCAISRDRPCLHRSAWERDTIPQEKLKKLETALTQYPWPLSEVAPLLAALPRFRFRRRTRPYTDARAAETEDLRSLLAWLLAVAERQPVLFMVEDLHWVDPSTLEWLSLVVEQSPTARLYGLFTFRPSLRTLGDPRLPDTAHALAIAASAGRAAGARRHEGQVLPAGSCRRWW